MPQTIIEQGYAGQSGHTRRVQVAGAEAIAQCEGRFDEGGGPWWVYRVVVVVDGQVIGTKNVDVYTLHRATLDIQDAIDEIIDGAIRNGKVQLTLAPAIQEVA